MIKQVDEERGEGAVLESRPGRPRNEDARRAVLEASYSILKEKGLSGFTIEAVAARARVAKTTIYRWWPSKGALAIGGFLAGMEPQISYKVEGSILANIKDQLRRVAAAYGGAAGRVLAAIIAEGQRDPATIREFIEGYSRPRREEAKAILIAGIQSGELREDIDLEVAVDALYGPIYYRMLIPLGPLNADWAEDLAEHVFAGIAKPLDVSETP